MSGSQVLVPTHPRDSSRWSPWVDQLGPGLRPEVPPRHGPPSSGPGSCQHISQDPGPHRGTPGICKRPCSSGGGTQPRPAQLPSPEHQNRE